MPSKKRKLSYDGRPRIVWMAEQGQSHRSIASQLGINRKTVDATDIWQTDICSPDWNNSCDVDVSVMQ